jgi:actin-related protein
MLDGAGREATIVITAENIEYIKSTCVDYISKLKSPNNIVNYYQKNWVYTNNKDNTFTNWHSHEIIHNLPNVKNKWTYVFYVQMPNNLMNNEGKLSFKVDNKEYNILPDEGDIIIFPATLVHKPEMSPNSTQERIVIGGNFVEIDLNKPLNKKQMTLV